MFPASLSFHTSSLTFSQIYLSRIGRLSPVPTLAFALFSLAPPPKSRLQSIIRSLFVTRCVFKAIASQLVGILSPVLTGSADSNKEAGSADPCLVLGGRRMTPDTS